MRLSQCETLTRCKTTVESTSPTHTFCRRPVCRLNKQGGWLKLDVGEFVEQRKVIEVEILRHHQTIFPGTTGDTHLHLTRACVEHKAELPKASAALCKRQIQRSMAPQPKSRCDNDSATR